MYYYIKVFDKTTPDSYELSHCKAVNQRLRAIRENIIAVQTHKLEDLPAWSERWSRFKNSNLKDICFEVFRHNKSDNLFGTEI